MKSYKQQNSTTTYKFIVIVLVYMHYMNFHFKSALISLWIRNK